uniref:NAD(P)(+)--arginine ADP-ribosyltransferase n=1 Tax=Amphilophus citrinellus TaxID=61819 RepID=A0A3Q0SVT9_AMPCI
SLSVVDLTHLDLDMATDYIDDMFDGCRSNVASIIDLFGVLEWLHNKKFSSAWTSAEKKAKRPVCVLFVYIYTKMKHIQQDFNEAVKTEKDKYNTAAFQFHYFYFYLTETIQVLHLRQRMCRITYHRTWEQFNQNKINTHMCFGAFISKNHLSSMVRFPVLRSTHVLVLKLMYYSYTNQRGQVIIPPYEEFLTNCHTVKKLGSCFLSNKVIMNTKHGLTGVTAGVMPLQGNFKKSETQSKIYCTIEIKL